VGVPTLSPFFGMPSSPDHQHYVRRVVLPSGKTIEVVYFEDLAVPTEAITAQPAPVDLHVCEHCASDLVFPVEWEEAGPDHWEVELRCPNCESYSSGVYSQEAVERFDEQLDDGTESLVGDLKRLVHANMEDEIERFVGALQAGLIVPDDF
jgi:hypothetical protein